MMKKLALLLVLLIVITGTAGSSWSQSSQHPEKAGSSVAGKVIEVDGPEVFIEFGKTQNGAPAAGQIVEIYHVTSTGHNLHIGNWQVISISGSVAKAGHISGAGTARVGQKALFLQEQVQDQAEKPHLSKISRQKLQLTDEKTVESSSSAPLPIESLSEGEVPHWWLGAGISNHRETGVVIRDIADNSPAARCGLKIGDIIMRIDQKRVADTNDVVREIRMSETGMVLLSGKRDGRDFNIPARLEHRP